MIILFTKKGFEDIKVKLEKTTAKRPETVKTLSRARDMGDLSENGLYRAAKFELSDIDREIRHLKKLILYGKVITPTNRDFVQVGHKVVIENENGKKEFLIVGEYEADPKLNKISNRSPFGFALMGKKVGDNIIINTPNGISHYKLLSIEI
jgi:transcription elongation factor GreA